MRPHAHYAYIYRERTYILTLTALCCHCPFLICRNFRKCVFPVVYIAGVVVTSTPISITHIFIELCFALIQFQFPCTYMAQVFPLHLIEYNPSPSLTQLNSEGCYYSLQIAMFDDIAGYIYVTCSIKLAMCII